jgi:sugar O-acyltransferase (sialic acid O-acetyltransferase NeuD family)
MTGILVLGTSGHARSCLDVAIAAGIDVRGCVGPQPSGHLQVPYLGDDEQLRSLRESGATDAFVAVGDNRVRQRLTEHVRQLGFRLRAVVSPHAFVAPTASIGDGAVVMHKASIGPYSTVGEGAILNTSASIDHDCVLGDFAHVAPGTHLAGDVIVGEGAFLGIGCSVIPGVAIGRWATAGAGATVIENVPAGTTVVGTPAKQRGKTA